MALGSGLGHQMCLLLHATSRCIARSTASGSRAKIISNARPGASIMVRPCSQLRQVATGTPSNSAMACCVKCRDCRTCSGEDARACIPLAHRHLLDHLPLNLGIARGIEPGIINLCALLHPVCRLKMPSQNLLAMRAARRNNMPPLAAPGENHHKIPPLNGAHGLNAYLAIILPPVFPFKHRAIPKSRRIGKIKTAFGKTCRTFGFVP